MSEKSEGQFLGKPFPYWIELEAQAKSLKYDTLILEIARLRAKVSFYESRMIEMSEFMQVAGGLTIRAADASPLESD